MMVSSGAAAYQNAIVTTIIGMLPRQAEEVLCLHFIRLSVYLPSKYYSKGCLKNCIYWFCIKMGLPMKNSYN